MRLNRRRPLSAYIFVLINYIEGQASDDSSSFCDEIHHRASRPAYDGKKKKEKKNIFCNVLLNIGQFLGIAGNVYKLCE